VNLSGAQDADICGYARREERIIISKDQDFLCFANKAEAKIRFIWFASEIAEPRLLLEAFARSWPGIEACLLAGDRVVEIR
jgi:predicted nuclease of predicted toxin-antitoxin system